MVGIRNNECSCSFNDVSKFFIKQFVISIDDIAITAINNDNLGIQREHRSDTVVIHFTKEKCEVGGFRTTLSR